MADKIEKDRRH